jgi:SAM-dependent methyltransferase
VEAKVQRWVQRHGWDRAVHHYQEHWRDQLRPAHEAVLALAALEAGEAVVEVACGTGMVTLPAAAAVGRGGRIVATDISGQMVDDTARRADECGHTQVETLRCDAETLGQALGDRSPFDVALCSLGLMYVPSPDVAVAEMTAALRPSGRMVAAVWGERRNCGWASIFPIVDARVESDVCPMFFALGAPGSLAGVMAKAGLDGIEEHRIDCELVYADEETTLAAAFLGGPVALAYSRFDADTKASASADYLASIAEFRHGAGYRIPGEFVIVAARRPDSESSQHFSQSNRHHQQQSEVQPI